MGKMSLWDLKTMKMDRELPLTPNSVAVNCMSFNHNGHLLVAGGVDGMIRLFGIYLFPLNSFCAKNMNQYDGTKQEVSPIV
jgi:WD40 repeat protein